MRILLSPWSTSMTFNLVSAWNRRRSKSLDVFHRWTLKPPEPLRLMNQSSSLRRRNRSLVFTLREMEEATGSFSDKNLIGEGGFGRVYKGTLADGEVVAIKKMDRRPSKKRADGEHEFRVEVDLLTRLEHPNLVTLIGYCADGMHRFLVYEFMPRGNLQDVLNGISNLKMEWPLRVRVALGAARGLAYLHSNSALGIPIVHRDFKSTNILLSEYFEAKISDFGLAKLMQENEDTYTNTRMLGTFGYFDPEYALTGTLTLKSDVYAFGVVLLELLTGRRALELNQSTADQNLILQFRNIPTDQKKRLRKVIDPEMARSSYTMETITMFVDLASRCLRIDSNLRPTMSECVKELQVLLYASMKA